MEDSIFLKSVTEMRLKEIMSEAVSDGLMKALDSRKELKYRSRKEKAEQLGISLPTLDKGIKNGDFKSVRIGGRLLIVDDE